MYDRGMKKKGDYWNKGKSMSKMYINLFGG